MQDANLMLRNKVDADLPAGATNGATIDYGSGDVGPLTQILAVGAMSGTNPVLNTKIQQSPNGTDWADLAFFAPVSAVPSWKNVTVHASERYRRAVFTVTGTGTPVFSQVSCGPDVAGHFGY